MVPQALPVSLTGVLPKMEKGGILLWYLLWDTFKFRPHPNSHHTQPPFEVNDRKAYPGSVKNILNVPCPVLLPQTQIVCLWWIVRKPKGQLWAWPDASCRHALSAIFATAFGFSLFPNIGICSCSSYPWQMTYFWKLPLGQQYIALWKDRDAWAQSQLTNCTFSPPFSLLIICPRGGRTTHSGIDGLDPCWLQAGAIAQNAAQIPLDPAGSAPMAQEVCMLLSTPSTL